MYAKSGIFQVYSQSCIFFYLQLMNKIFTMLLKNVLYLLTHWLYIKSNPFGWKSNVSFKAMFLSNILSYRFSLEFEMYPILSVAFSLSQASVSPCSVERWNIELRLSLGERFILLKFLSVIISKEILGPNGDRGIDNISGTEFICGTV